MTYCIVRAHEHRGWWCRWLYRHRRRLPNLAGLLHFTALLWSKGTTNPNLSTPATFRNLSGTAQPQSQPTRSECRRRPWSRHSQHRSLTTAARITYTDTGMTYDLQRRRTVSLWRYTAPRRGFTALSNRHN